MKEAKEKNPEYVIDDGKGIRTIQYPKILKGGREPARER